VAVTIDRIDALQVSRALETLGSLALREHSMDTLLQRVADLTTAVMPGRTEASISLVSDGRPATAVFTGPVALSCDETQYGVGDGPCLHAARTGEITEITDARTETRWPEYARIAVESGVLSSLSTPLPIHEGIRGALNVYGFAVDSFDDACRSAAAQFVPYAAVAISNMHSYEDARLLVENLQQALESRAVIDQAKGILMERYKLTSDKAFQVLARASMHTNTKLRTVAQELVLTGQLPDGRRHD
jgi:GAF domain-containing protein